MRNRLIPIIFATVVGLSAQASAAREYYLVGLRHVYMFDVWPDMHKDDRQAIEENFADNVNSAQQQYDADMASIRAEEAQDNGAVHQIDRDAVQQNIETAVADAADARDAAFSQLYVQCDYMRQTHREFQVDQDGAYQVMGVDTGPQGDFLYVSYYKPYPTYLDPCPYDWAWEHPYPAATFGLQIQLYHSTWLSIGAPVFTPLYDARGPITVLAPVRINVILNRSAWAGGRPPAITEEDRNSFNANKELQRKAGIRPPSAHPGRVRTLAINPAGAISRYSHVRTVGVTPVVVPPSRYTRGGRLPNTPPTGSTPVVQKKAGGAPRGHAGPGATKPERKKSG